MGDLSDELFKAGLISEEQYRQAKAVRKRGETGAASRGRPRRQRDGERGERRPRRRPSGRDRDAARREAEDREALAEPLAREGLRELVRAEALRGVSGLRRWYFVARDGRVPFLDVNDETARKLARGELAIVEVPDQKQEEFVIVPRRLAVRLRALEVELVRYLAP